MNRIRSFLWGILLSTTVTAQNTINYTFDDNVICWTTTKGKSELVEQGVKGKSLRLVPGTIVCFKLALEPASTYELSAYMRTESGSDNITMQINKLGQNNVSISTALSAWTEMKCSFHVSANQRIGELEFVFDDNPNKTCAWVDEICLKRIGDYKETLYTGIPDAPKREVKTEMGITMQPDEKMQWMLDGKLGMFIHWGLYAGPAKGEWYMENNGISIDEYRKLAYPESGDQYFDAKDFDARKWVDLAKKAGFRYVNLTTQHHDGYALFESKYMNAFTSKNTHNRDFVKEYVEACREAGLRVGLYKTLINWRFPGYYDVTGTDCRPGNKFGYQTAAWHKENARLMKEELYCQLKELMVNYGKIDQLFWDGGWLAQKGSDADGAYFWESGKYMDEANEWPVNPYFQDMDEKTGKPLGLMGIVRKYQPDILVNPRSGWCGDYTCEEGGGAVKGNIRSGVVEKCMSITPAWGYTKNVEDSKNVKSIQQIKRLCSDCMVRNMCFLINVGPDRHGNIPETVEQRLLEFGQWVNNVGEAIYGTRGGPWEPVDGEYGFTYKKNVIYIYFLGGYTAADFVMPLLDEGMRVKKVTVLSTGEKVKVIQKGKTIILKGIKPTQNEVTVLAVELNKNVR